MIDTNSLSNCIILSLHGLAEIVNENVENVGHLNTLSDDFKRSIQNISNATKIIENEALRLKGTKAEK